MDCEPSVTGPISSQSFDVADPSLRSRYRERASLSEGITHRQGALTAAASQIFLNRWGRCVIFEDAPLPRSGTVGPFHVRFRFLERESIQRHEVSFATKPAEASKSAREHHRGWGAAGVDRGWSAIRWTTRGETPTQSDRDRWASRRSRVRLRG